MAAGFGYQSAQPNFQNPVSAVPSSNFYADTLQGLYKDPSSYMNSPEFQAALGAGAQAVARSNAARGFNGSTNMPIAVGNYGTQFALQGLNDYMGRLGNQAAQQNQYNLGLGQNAIEGQRTANEFNLGRGNLALGTMQAQNNYALGSQANANNASRNYYDYTLGLGQNANQAAANRNQFDLGMYGAETNRGTAQSEADYRNSMSGLDWTKFMYQLYPRQRIAGGP